MNLHRFCLSAGVLVLAAVCALTSTSAYADFLISDPGQYTGSPTVVNFDGLTLGTVTQQSTIDALAAVGVAFGDVNGTTDGVNVVPGEIFGGPPSNRLVDFTPQGSGTGVIELTFSTPQQAISIDYIVHVGAPDLTFEAYSGSTLLGQYVSTGDMGHFGYGVEAPSPLISSILIHDSIFGFTLDNLTFGQATASAAHMPAPAGAVLAALGLGMVGFLKRRRAA